MVTDVEIKEAADMARHLINYAPRAEGWRVIRLAVLVDAMRRHILTLEEELRVARAGR